LTHHGRQRRFALVLRVPPSHPRIQPARVRL